MTEQELKDKGYEDVVFFRNYGYDGCIIGITTDNRAVYSFEKNGSVASRQAQYDRRRRC